MSQPDALRIRPVDGDLIGTTAFFRNRAFLEQFGAEIAAMAPAARPVEIFIHACSIGAEVYSLAIHLQSNFPKLAFNIGSTDLSPGFVQFAARARYPVKILEGMSEIERAFFERIGDGVVALNAATRACVTFEPPVSFVEFAPQRRYDAVSLCNALVYVDAAAQARAIDRIAGYNAAVLALTGGHHATVAKDLSRNGYRPVMARFKAIHAGWRDRQRPAGWRRDAPLPPNIHADPYLGPIDDAPGWRYRHGALFRKQAIAQAA